MKSLLLTKFQFFHRQLYIYTLSEVLIAPKCHGGLGRRITSSTTRMGRTSQPTDLCRPTRREWF